MTNIWDNFAAVAPKLPEAILVLVAGLILIPAVSYTLTRTLARLRFSLALRGMLTRLIRYGMYALLFIALLYALGFTGIAATLSGSLLVVGVVISQSFKNLLADMVAGLSIARDPDFEIGYTLEIAGKTRGVITQIGSRKVRLIDEKGYTRVLPNNLVDNSEWIVLDRQSTIKDTKRKT